MMGSKGGRECNIILGRAVPERGSGGQGSKGVGCGHYQGQYIQAPLWAGQYMGVGDYEGQYRGKIRQYYFGSGGQGSTGDGM